VRTRVEDLDLEVFPGVFHPKYFGSSIILAKFVSSLPLHGKSFLEIGCGSGVVALSAVRAGAEVTAVDVNPEAVRCTVTNAARNQLLLNAQVSDLFASIKDTQFDVIAWNPPFLPGEPNSPAEVSFYGGANFGVIRRFTKMVGRYLKPGGCTYTILSSDIPIAKIEDFFRNEGLAVSRVLSKRWKLGETMVILCAR
jgi:release factor glutamine methyltransferase